MTSHIKKILSFGKFLIFAILVFFSWIVLCCFKIEHIAGQYVLLRMAVYRSCATCSFSVNKSLKILDIFAWVGRYKCLASTWWVLTVFITWEQHKHIATVFTFSHKVSSSDRRKSFQVALRILQLQWDSKRYSS